MSSSVRRPLKRAHEGRSDTFQRQPWWNRTSLLVGLIAVMLMGIGLRAAYVTDYVTRDPMLHSPMGEAAEHTELALAISNGYLTGPEFLATEPLYPLILGAYYRLAGHSPLRVLMAQVVLGLTILMLTFWLGLKVASPEVGVLASGLLCLYGPLLTFETKTLPATAAMALHLVALIVLIPAPEGPPGSPAGPLRMGRALGGGLLVGLLTWVRPWLLVFPLLRALGGIPGLRRLPWPARRPFLVGGAWVLIGLTAMLTLLYVRNAQSGAPGSLMPARYSLLGYAGNHPGAQAEDSPPPGFSASRRHWMDEARQRAGGGLSHPPASVPETSRHFTRLALRGVLAAPGEAVLRVGAKGLAFSGKDEPSSAINVTSEMDSYLALRLAAMPFSLLLGLGVLGLAWVRLRGRAWLVASLGAHLLFCLVVSVSSEVRITVAPVLAVAAGAALFHLARQVSLRRDRRPGLIATSLSALVLILTLVLVFLPSPTRARRTAEDGLLRAEVLLGQNRPLAAREALGPAKGVPSLAVRATHLDALVSQRLGEHRVALDRLRQVLADQPRRSAAHTDVARSYLHLAHRAASRGDRGEGADRLHEALAHLEKAVALDPHGLDGLVLLAQTSRAMGQLKKAESLLGRALSVAPSRPEVHLELAILAAMGEDLPRSLAHLALARLLGGELPPPYDGLFERSTPRSASPPDKQSKPRR